MLRNSRVHLWAACLDAIELPQARNAHHAVVISRGEIDLATNNCFFRIARFGEHPAREIDDLRMAGKAEPALFTHAVGSDDYQMIFGGADLGSVLPGIGADWPIRGNT